MNLEHSRMRKSIFSLCRRGAEEWARGVSIDSNDQYTALKSKPVGELSNHNMKESEWSEEILLNMGVKKEDIILERNSRNTMENAQQTAIIIGADTINKSLLITSGSHMRRAKLCFLKNNLNIETYSTDCISTDIPLTFNYLFIPNVQALEKWESLIHEWIGYIIYKIKF